MGRDEISALMEDERLGAYEDERLNQHFLEKCSTAELERINFANQLSVWLMDRRDVFGARQAMFCRRVAIEATGRIFDEMPPAGPLHEIN